MHSQHADPVTSLSLPFSAFAHFADKLLAPQTTHLRSALCVTLTFFLGVLLFLQKEQLAASPHLTQPCELPSQSMALSPRLQMSNQPLNSTQHSSCASS